MHVCLSQVLRKVVDKMRYSGERMKAYPYPENLFEVSRWDFIITEDLDVYLLEVSLLLALLCFVAFQRKRFFFAEVHLVVE